jgi:molecular chaperone GrpE
MSIPPDIPPSNPLSGAPDTDTVSLEGVGGAAQTIDVTGLQEALKQTQTQLAEQQEAWLRAKAETENVRRRAQEDVLKASKFAAEKFAGAMLPVKDSLEAALSNQNQTLETLREGVDLTLKQLASAFEGAALTEENPVGQKFDPNRHQAIGMQESDQEANTVITVLQKGYRLNERVLRPAMVMVSKGRATGA